ncbi:MAG: PAS domain-containing protein [Microscillaceae bacterium]|jgi:PAS domain S-box-containing protein|nr:PAS domain-containing protein [Microscillaceae bacterium]
MPTQSHRIYTQNELEDLSKAELIALVQKLQKLPAEADPTPNKREATLQVLVEQADDFVCAIDLQSRVLTINHSYRTYVKNHYGVDLNIGDQAFGYLKPEQQSYWAHLITKVSKGETIKKEILSTRNPQNYWQFTFSPLYDSDRQIIGISYFARDISKLKLSEQSLQLQTQELAKVQANFTTLINNTDDFICSLDLDFRILIINNAYQNFIQNKYNVRIAIGDIIFDKLPQNLRGLWSHLSHKALKGQKINKILQSTSDPNIFWEISINPIYSVDKDIIGLSFFIKNIGELVKNEQALRQLSQELAEKEANLSALIENTHDLICSVDAQYRLITANSAYLNYIQRRYNHHLQKGEYMFSQSSAEIEHYWLPIYNRALAGEAFKMERHYLIDNQDVWLEHSFNPIREKDGKVSGISFFMKDITLDKQKEAIMRENYQQLQKINAELDRFVYSVSHDLRAPLASILGLIEISRAETQLESRDNYLNLMQKSVKKLDSFIRDIIDFSRNARLEVNRDKIVFADLLPEILAELHYLPETQYLQITYHIHQPFDFQSDSKRIQVVLQNLLSNAIRYSDKFKDQPYIHIRIETSPQEAYIVIEDNGQGIGQAHLDKIFEMFYRASTHTSGSGLGLYIVKETMHKLQGSIEVKSELGKGSSFILKIPGLPIIYNKEV